MINFYNFAVRAENFTAPLQRGQYTGDTIDFTIPASFLKETTSWTGDLLYAEVLIEPQFVTTKYAVQRLFIRRVHHEDEYNNPNWFKRHWKTLVIVLVAVVFVVFVFVDMQSISLLTTRIIWYAIHNRDVFVRVKEA